MSIMIKGIKFPDVGVRDVVIAFANHCLLITDECGKELFYGEYVEIPTPHGRLIDADRLMEVIGKNSYLLKGYYNSLENGMFLTGIKQAIDEAPTIIDVEENK